MQRRTSNTASKTSNLERPAPQGGTPVLVSACLLGLKTRYDGTDNYEQCVSDYLQQHNLMPIAVCPEQLGGLPTPRQKCWFSAGDGADILSGTGRLRNETGEDLGPVFVSGAEQALKLADLTGCRQAILKERSPSCGSNLIHCNGEVVPGMGVAAALLKQHGLEILSETTLAEK